jgi:hypothetical protein
MAKGGKTKVKANVCTETRLTRYPSKAKADEEILSAKIRVATNGGRNDQNRESQNCLKCGGWHIVLRRRGEGS